MEDTDIKFYQCASWTDDVNHGGAIGAVEISDGDEVVFPDVTSANNVAGLVTYRKIYVKNTHESQATALMSLFFSPVAGDTTPADQDEVYLLKGGTKSLRGSSATLTGTLNFTNGSTVVTGVGTAFLTELAVGELVYNGSDDTTTVAGIIQTINSNTELILSAFYTGTTKLACTGKVAPITMATFGQPLLKADGAQMTLAAGGSVPIWLKRIVSSETAMGATNHAHLSNYFILIMQAV